MEVTCMEKPIGVFDSGLGGVSVLREAIRILPHEDFIYYGDNRNAPYGDRKEQEITKLTMHCAHALARCGAKAILIACNTATATCIEQIRSDLNIPVVSVEPAIKPACMQPGNGKILMMATQATTHLKRYLALQARMPTPARVINVPCPGLVERIERGILGEDAFDDLLDQYLSAYHTMQIDGIVLGCTHYALIGRAIARYYSCPVYDGVAGTVDHLQKKLNIRSENASKREKIDVIFAGSGKIRNEMVFFGLK